MATRRSRPVRSGFAALSLVPALLVGVGACADQSSEITIDDAVMSAAVDGRDAAVYLTISNTGGIADDLVDVEVDGAAMAHLHTTSIDPEGTSTMSTSGPIHLEPGDEVRLSAGGLHLMVVDPPPVSIGDEIGLALRFARAGTVEARARVVPPADVPVAGSRQ